jgi:hypothetical protein
MRAKNVRRAGMKKLFDEDNGLLLLDEMVFNRPSYRAIIEDKIVTDEEIMEQSNRVIELFKKIDRQLNPADKDLVLDTICELSVLHAVSTLKGGKQYGGI